MFTLLFVAFLVADNLIKLILAMRQIRHVAQHRDQVPAEFDHHISLKSHQRAADYTIRRTKTAIAERLVDSVFLLALTLLGGLQALDLFFGRHIEGDLLRQLLLVGSVFLLSSLVQLPFSLWRIFKIDEDFGFNRMTPGLFISDTFKAALLAVVLGAPLLAAVIWLMDSAPGYWPLWAWVIWVLFSFLIMWLFPQVIAPLFNRFEPLEQEPLKSRIEALAQRCQFALNGLFVMDGSKRSAHGNAYFTGIGKNKRIVFFDTLLNRLNEDEIEAVLAHELGHFKHRHITKRLILNMFLALVFLLLLGWLSQQVWFYTDLGVIPQLGRPNSGLALILFFLVIPVFSFWLGPLFSVLSRKDEYQADQFAAEQSSATALISALVKLYDDNAATLTPDPAHSAFYDSHPPAPLRIQQLKQYANRTKAA